MSEKPDTYLVFRKNFILPSNGAVPVQLEIAADSTYEIRINGQRCPGSQLADMPFDRTCASYDISRWVRAGENLIAVEVHYIGSDFLTYRAGPAFLRAAVYAGGSLITATDPTWKWAFSEAQYCRF